MLMGLYSCGFLHYMATKEAENKSENEIEDYLIKNKIAYADFSISLPDDLIDSLSAKEHALHLWQLERGVPQSTIQLRVYDSLGKLINGYVQCYGDFKRLNILSEKDLRMFEHLPNNYDLLFDREFHLWGLNDAQEKEILSASKGKKYRFVVYWNIWSNYYSRVMLKEISRYLKKYQAEKTTMVILVNTDYTPKKSEVPPNSN